MHQQEIEQTFREEIELLNAAAQRAQAAQAALAQAQQEVENRQGALRMLEKLYPDVGKKMRAEATPEPDES